MIPDSAPFKYGQLGEIQRVLREATEQDFQWLRHGRVPGQKPDQVYNPWMPFQPSEFVAMLTECVAECDGPRFLDVGSGIGTKLSIAKYLFGLDTCGIEIDPQMEQFASSRNRFTVQQDALEFPHYDDFDIIWLYRPFKDGFRQARLENLIFEKMGPGAIVVGGAWENKPNGFEIILDDWDTGNRGAYRKPADWVPVQVNFKE